MNTNIILPCPTCGSRNIIRYEDEYHTSISKIAWAYICDDCLCNTHWSYSKTKALRNWQTRHIDSKGFPNKYVNGKWVCDQTIF